MRIEQDSILKCISQSAENILQAVRKEETLKEGKGEKGKLDVQKEHAEAVLNKGLHRQFTK